MKKMRFAASLGAAAALVLMFQGCANYQSVGTFDHTGSAIVREVNYPVFPTAHSSSVEFDMSADKFDVVGVVSSKTESENILGVVSNGGGGLAELLAEAKAAGGDDVINLKADSYRKTIGFPIPFSSVLFEAAGITFYAKSELTLIGTAIKYKK